ncbi:MAG: carbohydrate ABC transporter permease [Thermomicrobiales bacterium]
MATITDTSATVERGRPLVVPRGRGRDYARYIGAILRYSLLIALSLIFLFPFYLVVRNGLMTQPEITGFEWKWWPASPQWENFTTLFDDPLVPMATGLRNSAILAVINLVFQTLFASMAGYALARIRARGSGVVFFVLLTTLMVPSAVTFIPSYVVLDRLGGVGTLWGIVVPGLFNAFATFLFRQFYLDFPVEIEEAARLDGLSYFGIYRAMILPNSMGIMMALGVLSFIYSWNAFLWPLVVARADQSVWTVQIVLSTYLTAQTINLPALFMGALVGAAPLIAVFLIMQRYIVQGVRLSGIKG